MSYAQLLSIQRATTINETKAGNPCPTKMLFLTVTAPKVAYMMTHNNSMIAVAFCDVNALQNKPNEVPKLYIL